MRILIDFMTRMFHLHTWGKWEIEAEGTMSTVTGAVRGFWVRQSRICQTCGYTQINIQDKRGLDFY